MAASLFLGQPVGRTAQAYPPFPRRVTPSANPPRSTRTFCTRWAMHMARIRSNSCARSLPLAVSPNDERRDRGDDVGKPAPLLSRVATARRTAKSYPWMEPSGPTRGLGSVSLCVPGATATMGKAMPRVRSADQRSPAHSPTCPACGKAMRLVMAAPATPYTNLKHATFECDCGGTGHALIADRD